MVLRLRRYLGAVRTEAQRVSWPTRKEVIMFTILIFFMVLILGLYLGLMDYILQWIVASLIR